MKALEEKIYSYLAADTTLQSLLGADSQDSRIYPDVVNQFEKFPCVTYSLVSSSENTVPANTQDSLLDFRVFTDNSAAAIKSSNLAILERLKTLLKYYGADTPIRIWWSVKVLETEEPSDDRNLYVTLVRYRIWTKGA